MQLILETEPNIDVKKDMAKLNVPLDEKLITNGVSEEPETNMFEKNKEKLLSQDDVIGGAESTTENGKMVEESVIKENLLIDKETTQCSSVENVDTNITRTEVNSVEHALTNYNDEERQEVENLKRDDICVNEDVCEENIINQESESDQEPAKNLDTHLTKTKDITFENCSIDKIDEEKQEDKELKGDDICVNHVCEENNINQECNENREVEENRNDEANEDSEETEVHAIMTDVQMKAKNEVTSDKEEETENITTFKEDIEFKEELIDDFDIDEESNTGVDIDYFKIEEELSDEEKNVASDDAIFVNQENSNSVNDVINTKEANVSNCLEENEDGKMEISETPGISPGANDKCLSNSATDSGYVTAIPSVDDQQKCTVKEGLSDDESKLTSSDNPKKNLEKDSIETDDTTKISLTEESNKTTAVVLEKSIDDNNKNLDQETIERISQMPLNDESKNTTIKVHNQPINIDNNIKDLDHENKEPGDMTQATLDIDNDIKDLDHEDNKSSDLTQTPLTDELKMSIAGLHDKVINVDDNTQDLDREKMELGEIAHIPLADKAKITISDLPDKVIKNHNQETEEFVKDTASIKEVKATPVKEKEEVKKKPAVVCKLSNTLDILSDDEDEPPNITEQTDSQLKEIASKQYINIEDDDDIMLIDEDTDSKDSRTESCDSVPAKTQTETSNLDIKENDNNKSDMTVTDTVEFISDNTNKESTRDVTDIIEKPQTNEKTNEQIHKINTLKPLLPDNFLKSAKKNLVDMTRDDLEEFCILKIVESVMDRSNLNEIKTKLKNMMHIVKEYSNKAKMLTKQNRDLQVVMKSIQEEQKKKKDAPIAPLKITRSVGMQVFLTDKVIPRRKGMLGPNTAQANLNKHPKIGTPVNSGQRTQRQVQVNNQNQIIPVPRLVPATPNNVTVKAPSNQVTPISNQSKASSPITNGVKNAASTQKSAEKRTHNRIQSVTVDLTDDEPPAKVPTRISPAQPVRLLTSQNLIASQRPQLLQSNSSSPRKVYIPISGPQGQNLRPGQYMLKSVSPSSGPRPRGSTPHITRMPQNQVKVQRVQPSRHPAALPDAMKQYQPPNWKSLPPAPDIKLSKVENGIVISWKIDGYIEDIHEEIASYQLYAYQETPSPPSTALWKKIGDVKALPLPMACTLTQFMSGFKYYFAVRAIDVRSRLGPFCVPGSILLLNKM